MAGEDDQAANQAGLQGLVGGHGSGIERLPMLRVGLDNVGKVCAEDLKVLSSIPMRLKLAAVDMGTAGDLLGGERGTRAVALFEAPGWATRIVVSAERAAIAAIVECLLGGDGSQPPPAPDRALSKIEVGVAGVFFASIANALSAAFTPIAPTAFNLLLAADQLDFERVPRSEPMAAAKFSVEALGSATELLVAIPRAALEALQKPLSRVPSKNARPDPGWKRQIEKEVARATVTLIAVLDERPGTLGEITQFRVGEVLELKASPHSKVGVECNGERAMWCDLGKSGGVYTLRFDTFVNREQEFIDDIRAA